MPSKHPVAGAFTATGALTLYAVLHLASDGSGATPEAFASPIAGMVRWTGLACVATLCWWAWRAPARRTFVAALLFVVAAVPFGIELVLAISGVGTPIRPFWSIDRASPETRKQITALAQEFGVSIDPRHQGEFLDGLRQQGLDAVPAVMLGDMLGEDRQFRDEPVDADQLMPLGGLASTLTVLCNESGRYVLYESDEHGFRNPGAIWDSARADLGVVGQSFAVGYCVPDGKSFVDLLRPQYPATFNLGIAGQNSVLQLAAIKEYLHAYTPRIVLWVFSEGNDLLNLYDQARHRLVGRYLTPGFTQHLIARQPEIDSAIRDFVDRSAISWRDRRATARRSPWLGESLGLMKLWHLRQAIDSWDGITSDDERGMSVLAGEHNPLRDALAQAQTLVRSWGGDLYFVYLPSWNRYANGPAAGDVERRKVLSLVTGLGLPIIDVEPAFNAHGDPLSLFPFRRFGHFNEEGNRVVADAIRNMLPYVAKRIVTD